MSLGFTFVYVFFYGAVSLFLWIFTFFKHSSSIILKLSNLLFSCSSVTFVCSIPLFDILLGTGSLLTGILGLFLDCSAAGSTFVFSSYYSFQLFFFLLGEGLASLVFLSALNFFYPLIDRCSLISSPTFTFSLFKNYEKERDFSEIGFLSYVFLLISVSDVEGDFETSTSLIFFLLGISSSGLLKKVSTSSSFASDKV